MRMLKVCLIMLLMLSLLACQTTEEPTESDIDPTIVETPTESTIETPIDPIEQIFINSTQIDNYTMTVLIYNQSDIYTLTIKVTPSVSSLEIDGSIEYFTKQDDVCLHYIPTSDGHLIETVTCADQETVTFDFFGTFEKSWFSEVDGKYYMNIGQLQNISDFFNLTMEGAEAANFELILGETYFEQFLFDVHVLEELYRFDMTFSDVGTTSVVVPTEG